MEMAERNTTKDSRRPTFRKNLVSYVTDYTENSGIHGVKYICEKQRPTAEKFLWLALLVVSFYICFNMVTQTWIKWLQTPVMISFSQSPTNIWEIPFPAVTVCPQSKVNTRRYNVTAAFRRMWNDNVTSDEIRKFSDASLLCGNRFNVKSNQIADSASIDFFTKIAPSLRDVFGYCYWESDVNCNDIFSPTLTNEGVCFTFNMMDKTQLYTKQAYIKDNYGKHKNVSNWTIDDGFFKNNTTPNTSFPRRAITSGDSDKLSLTLQIFLKSISGMCYRSEGFKILLHHPAEVPRFITRHFRASVNQIFDIAVKPEMTVTSPNVKNYDPHFYTQENCHVECLANYTLATCGCVGYYMPHVNSTTFCTNGDNEEYKCLRQAERNLLHQQMISEILSSQHKTDKNPLVDCDCLPSCTSIVYNAEISQSGYQNKETKFKHVTILDIYFKEKTFTSAERNELFSPDFWANCGGLLGLFTGFSVLSIVELAYFLTLRLICNCKRYGKHFWAGVEVHTGETNNKF